MKLKDWDTKSRRITLHPYLAGKTREEKCLLVADIVGSFAKEDWTRDDIELVRRLYKKCGGGTEIQTKVISEKFFTLLYNENRCTYRKFCFFGRSPKCFSVHIDCALESRFCTLCSANFHDKPGACLHCRLTKPKTAKKHLSKYLEVAQAEVWTRPGFKEARVELIRKKYNVDNVFQLDWVKEKSMRTIIERFGENPRKAIQEIICATNMELYDAPYMLQLEWVREKGRDTMEEKYGERFAMRVKKFFDKAFSKSRHIYSGILQGKKYKVQGKSAIHMLKHLVKKHGAENVESEFSTDYPDYAFSEMRTFPDFYLGDLDTFIECKSWWTFMGRTGNHKRQFSEGSISANKEKARIANKSGNKVIWAIHYHDKKAKKHSFFQLPRYWYKLSDEAVRELVNNFILNNQQE
jgi:hypothetical protein